MGLPAKACDHCGRESEEYTTVIDVVERAPRYGEGSFIKCDPVEGSRRSVCHDCGGAVSRTFRERFYDLLSHLSAAIHSHEAGHEDATEVLRDIQRKLADVEGL